MKRLLLMLAVLATGAWLQAQSIQLPGMGSTNITIESSQISSGSQLTFGNPEYNITGFTMKFPTNSNPDYVATSTNNHFTSDMLTNISQIVPGSSISLEITLQAPGEGHTAWQKTYSVQLHN
jgi:hypothetical protein